MVYFVLRNPVIWISEWLLSTLFDASLLNFGAAPPAAPFSFYSLFYLLS
jgi:hypothetical protein